MIIGMDIECDCAIESCVRSSNLPSADRGSSAPDTAGRTGEAADGLRSGTCERTSRRAAPRPDATATAMPITRRGFPFASTSLASQSSRTLARAASRLVSCRVVSLASSRLSQKERSTSRAQNLIRVAFSSSSHEPRAA